METIHVMTRANDHDFIQREYFLQRETRLTETLFRLVSPYQHNKNGRAARESCERPGVSTPNHAPTRRLIEPDYSPNLGTGKHSRLLRVHFSLGASFRF